MFVCVARHANFVHLSTTCRTKRFPICDTTIKSKHLKHLKNKERITYIADSSCPLGQVIERAADVEQSHVESVQEGQTLLEDEHGR